MHSQVHIITAEYDKIPTIPSRSRHKPWPGRKVTKVDEVITYKSTFPDNVHLLGKGDDVQGKALNVGVLDWSSLEKWSYFEKHVAIRRGGDSPSSSNSSSSPFSTSISSSQSVRSLDSPRSQRKQSPTLVACQNPYSRTIHTKASIRHNHEHDKINKSDIKGISQDSSQHPDIGSSPCTPKINDRSAFSQKNMKMEFPQSCEQGFPGNVHLVENDLPDQRSLIESTRDCLDESDCESSISVYSSMNRSTKVNENSMTEIFPPNGINFELPSPQISYSCPLPVSENKVPIAGGKEDHLKLDRINHGLFEKFTSQAEVKVAARPKRDLSPQRLLRAGLNRIKSSSSSSGQEIKQIICSDNSCDDSATSNRKARRSPSPQRLLSAGLNLLRNSTVKEGLSETDNSLEDAAASNIRGRRSPLRRIFDPLKSKTQVHFSGPITSLPSHRAQGASTRDKLPIHNELKSATSTRQALVKLAWKNGLPLFVFSSCDANILVATIGKGAASQNSKYECTYTIFTDHVELKKNDRVWTSPIKKNKKYDSADNAVIGQMRVSTLKSTKEFVLYGGEQTSTTNEHFSSLFRNEVVAIVIQDQSQIELKNEKLAMVAILPSGVHGISSAGEPSPLIERWKSGGSCDCGGWDEGCILTVLSDKNQETSSSLDGACTEDETHRIELFMQGETKENKHAFSMITFKEGVYTVDFRASISSLQVFAICVAILHSRKPITLSGWRYPVEARSFEEQTIVDHVRVNSASYEHHPPLSPIGRA